MSERVSTAGMQLAYAVEATKGEMPKTGFKVVPEVKSMPSFNPTPSTIDSTTLAETEYMTYVPGLKDLGGALEYGANLTDDLVTFWDACIQEYETNINTGKAMWWAVIHPKLKKATLFTGVPSPLGFNEASVGAMAETTLYVTPTSAPQMVDKPTVAGVSLMV